MILDSLSGRKPEEMPRPEAVMALSDNGQTLFVRTDLGNNFTIKRSSTDDTEVSVKVGDKISGPWPDNRRDGIVPPSEVVGMTHIAWTTADAAARATQQELRSAEIVIRAENGALGTFQSHQIRDWFVF